ncbi:MAG: cell division protein FtsL [Pseudomonadota bacterium]|nr:MAG: cell division protein FtsL [Pseudomonadota bacterium]
MARLNLLLLAVLTLCALGLVTSQHKARKLVIAHEREQARAHLIDIEWGQLQLEQSTWGTHQRIERLARERLQMDRPAPHRVQVVRLVEEAAR